MYNQSGVLANMYTGDFFKKEKLSLKPVVRQVGEVERGEILQVGDGSNHRISQQLTIENLLVLPQDTPQPRRTGDNVAVTRL